MLWLWPLDVAQRGERFGDLLLEAIIVDVIGHEDISMNGAAILGGGLDQPNAIVRVILGHEENRLAIIAALNDVQRRIRRVVTPPRLGSLPLPRRPS